MPYEWKAPDVAMVASGFDIFHTYRNGNIDERREFWFTTDQCECEDYEFDARSLPVPPGVDADNLPLIIAHAIDQDLLPIACDAECDISSRVDLEITGGCMGEPLSFDIRPWLLNANIDELVVFLAEDEVKVGDLLAFLRDKDYQVAGLLVGKSLSDIAQLQGQVRKDEAETFLQNHHPEAYWQAMCGLGRAVHVEASVEEDLTIAKDIDAYVPLSPSLQAEYRVLSESLEVELDHDALVNDVDFEQAANDVIRELAYARTIAKGDHGWDPVRVEQVVIKFSIPGAVA